MFIIRSTIHYREAGLIFAFAAEVRTSTKTDEPDDLSTWDSTPNEPTREWIEVVCELTNVLDRVRSHVHKKATHVEVLYPKLTEHATHFLATTHSSRSTKSKRQSKIMLPNNASYNNEEESTALRATVAVNYGLEQEQEEVSGETKEEVVTTGTSRPLFGSRWCVPFVRPTSPEQAKFVGAVDILLFCATALPPPLGLLGSTPGLGPLIYPACWVGMRFFGYWFFRNDTTPVLEYHCAEYEQRLNDAVPKRLQIVPFKWPMTVRQSYIASVIDFAYFWGMMCLVYSPHSQPDDPNPLPWPWIVILLACMLLFQFFWVTQRWSASFFRFYPTYRWGVLMEFLKKRME